MLTKSQARIFEFVREFQSVHGTPPSTRRLGAEFGIAQPSALAHLHSLASKGFLSKAADGRWGLKAIPIKKTAFEVPIFGSIPAGAPQMREQESEGSLVIDSAAFGISPAMRNRVWLLRVQGDSMIGVNITDGDLVVLVRREPKSGNIIAALVDDTTATLKILMKERGRYILRAANPRYADIAAQRLECQGVAVGLIRPKLKA